MRSHDKRKYNQGRAFQQHEQQEAVVDDLLIASMAVASTWGKPSSDSDASDSSDSDTDDGEDTVGQEEETLGTADQEDNAMTVAAAQKEMKNTDDVVEDKQNSQVAEIRPINPSDMTTTEDQNDENIHGKADSDDDDDSDIDLTENLANMLDEDDDIPTKKKSSSTTRDQKSFFKGPHTENEIDPYTCPTDELEKLNVSVNGSKHDIISTKVDDDGGIVVDDTIRKSLRIAGTVRSHIIEQRTIVVDSFIPVTLQSQCGNLVNATLDEGSMLVIVTTKDDEGKNIATSLKDDDGSSSFSLQVIGKVMEVFGPVQRPLYVIRLPEKDTKPKTDDTTNAKMNEDGQSEKPVDLVDGKEVSVPSTEDTNEITIESLEDEAIMSRTDEGNYKEDPWDAAGPLTTMIKSCSSVAVYSLMDHSNLIDTDQIIRVSGKGCDASNMHDEEVGAKELEYSDDEDERQAKRKGKKKPAHDNSQRADINRGRGGGRGDTGRGNNRGGRGHWNNHNQVHQTHPQQPHVAYPPQNQTYQGHFPNQVYQGHPQNQMYQGHQMFQAPPPQNYAYSQPTPYQNAPQYQHYQQQYQQQQQSAAHPHSVPPPPPPPPTQPQAQQQQESDTVYYDYSGS